MFVQESQYLAQQLQLPDQAEVLTGFNKNICKNTMQRDFYNG